MTEIFLYKTLKINFNDTKKNLNAFKKNIKRLKKRNIN